MGYAKVVRILQIESQSLRHDKVMLFMLFLKSLSSQPREMDFALLITQDVPS